MKNYGLDWERELKEQSDDDWLGGAIGEDLAQIPEDLRFTYLPKGELQRGTEDFMDCATRSVLNILEMKFNYLLKNKKLSLGNELWLKEKGYVGNTGIEFADAFNAIKSGTTRQGNSLKSPLDSVRKDGLIPKSLLLAKSDMNFDTYHNPERITGVMELLGKDFVSRFHINYEKVFAQNFAYHLKKDALDVAGYAWPEPINGEYPRIEETPNHAFMAIKPAYYIFDNYIDTVDSDWTKKLAENYSFLGYGYRISVNQKPIAPTKPLLDRLVSWLGSWCSPPSQGVG